MACSLFIMTVLSLESYKAGERNFPPPVVPALLCAQAYLSGSFSLPPSCSHKVAYCISDLLLVVTQLTLSCPD